MESPSQEFNYQVKRRIAAVIVFIIVANIFKFETSVFYTFAIGPVLFSTPYGRPPSSVLDYPKVIIVDIVWGLATMTISVFLACNKIKLRSMIYIGLLGPLIFGYWFTYPFIDNGWALLWMRYRTLYRGLYKFLVRRILRIGTLLLVVKFTNGVGKAKPKSKEEPRYRYKELTGCHGIRLLKLSRASHLADVKLDLIHSSLTDAPAYEAISYTWANQTKNRKIEVHGFTLGVTPNVFQIIQSQASHSKTKFLWIDSICINQDDSEEKSKQVRLMANIYRRASRVVVWLGNSQYAYLAFDLLKELKYFVDNPRMHARRSLVKHFSNHTYYFQWMALTNLLYHPWFERVWIIQEVAVASTVDIFCGGEYLPWETLKTGLWSIAIADIEQNQDMTGLLQLPRRLTLRGLIFPEIRRKPIGLLHVGSINLLRRDIQRDQKYMSFTDVMAIFSRFKATNPRDKVFALQGITADADNGSLVPDYNKSVEDVFFNAARYFLSQDDPLRMLSFAGIGDERNFDLPSWVPDLSVHTRAKKLTVIPDWQKHKPYRASADSVAHFKLAPTLDMLSLRGILIDSIDRLGSVLEYRDEPDTVVDFDAETIGKFTQLKKFRDLAATTSYWYPYRRGENRYEAFWRTVSGDRSRTQRPLPAVYGEYYQRAEASWTRRSRRRGWSIWPLSEDETEAHHFLERVSNCAYERRFCITKQGFMGMVPPKTETGDVVSIIFGCQTPYILRGIRDKAPGARSASNTYRLIGECYMHGMMDGEMMETPRGSEEILLR